MTLKVKKIFIDVGHGGEDSGATGYGLEEKFLNLDIALRQKNLFEALGYEVKLSRETDKTLSLKDRVEMANEWGADLVISNHINAYNGKAQGEEVWCSIYGIEGRKIAESVEAELDNLLFDRGVKSKKGRNGDYLYIIRNTKMPTILIEYGFIDNKHDANLLNQEAFRQKCAEAVVKGISGKLPSSIKPQNNKFYKVQVGAYSNKENALQLKLALARSGFNGFIKFE